MNRLQKGSVLPVKQCIYNCRLQAKRLFSDEVAPPKYKADEAFDLYSSEDYEHSVNINVKEDDRVQNFVESNAYLRGIRSYFRLIIVKYSHFTCNFHFDVCCSKGSSILCAGKCTNPECSGKVFITSNGDRSVLTISLKGLF